jgi:hypothetical protein
MHVPIGNATAVASADRCRTCRYERADPLADSTAPAPPERPRRNALWTKPAVRLAVLLACLVALIAVAVARFSGSAPSARGASACVASRLPSVPEIGPARLSALRASLLQAVARAGGRRYAGGIAVPLAFWSDEPPHTIGASHAARAAKLTVATADRLACELPDAGCTRAAALS